MTITDLHVGHDPAATKARFLEAMGRAEAGPIQAERHVTFESWDGLARVLSGKRLELLRHLRQHPARSIADLARTLGRDYKRVHEDVEMLSDAGLIDRTEDGGLRSTLDEIRIVISLAPAA